MNGSDILALVLLGVVVAFGLILYFVPIGLWITALFSGASADCNAYRYATQEGAPGSDCSPVD